MLQWQSNCRKETEKEKTRVNLYMTENKPKEKQ